MAHRLQKPLSYWLLLGLFVSGCNGATNPWKALPPPTALLTNGSDLWQKLAERRAALQNLKGLATVSFHTPLRNGTLDDTVVVLQQFDAIRLEGLGPLGQPLFLFVANRQDLSLYAPQEARFTFGAASAANFERLFGITMSPHVLQYVLFGDVPVTTLPTTGEFAYRARDNLYLWEGYIPEDPWYYRIWFEPYDLQPVRVTMEEPRGNVFFQVQYEDLQRFERFLMPRQIVLTQPAASHRVVWRYNDIQLNSAISPTLFRIQPPLRTERLDLDQLPQQGTLPLLQVW